MPEKATPSVPTRVLLVDDDIELCELLTEYLVSAGFAVCTAHDVQRGTQEALHGEHSLVVLDVMLPGGDGFEVLRSIRASSTVPVLMLTVRGDDVDRIVGLELGADDYLPKPFNPRELVARIHAILRRARTPHRAAPPRLVAGDLEMDTAARVVRCAGHPVELTGAEFALLEVLLHEAGRVVPREDLARMVLGRRLTPFDRSIDMHMSNLRKKLGPGPQQRERIKTVRGLGYIYVLPGEDAGAPDAANAAQQG